MEVYIPVDGTEIRVAFGGRFARSVSVPSGRGACGPSDGLVRSLRSRTSPIYGVCEIADAICKSLRDFANPALR